ncbi:uncharacterized protein [Parasteatoda tepidariorum]|uniref:uncharacterized protein isoform X2 n=1 Tax=Parasteatoda tepidariorum TaxID=114398 RepID=UPI001C717CD1|nr:uncharacterized protein LOC107451436 isoform X2 [Parasteatoda tepidariorum]
MESIILYVLRGDGSLTSVVHAAKLIRDHLRQRKEDVLISCERIRRSIAKKCHPDVVEMWIYFESIITAKTDIGNYNYVEELNAWSPIIRIHAFLRSRRNDRQDYIDGGILARFRTADNLVTQRTGNYRVDRPRRASRPIKEEPTDEEVSRKLSKKNNCAECCEDHRVLERRTKRALHGHGNHDPLWLQNVNQCPYCKDMWDENHQLKFVDVEPEWWFL